MRPALTLALIALALAGCNRPEDRVRAGREIFAPGPEAAGPSLPGGLPADEPPPPLCLGAGDEVEIEVLGQRGTRQIVRLAPDGRLHYGPLAGIPAKGLLLSQAQAAIEAGLTALYRHPHVSIELRVSRSRTATVLGRVATARVVPLTGGERVLDLVAACGGFASSRMTGTTEELADLSAAIYLRGGRRLAVDLQALVGRGDRRQDIRVHPGDILIVPSRLAREVTVLGAVARPGPVGWQSGLGLIGVLAAAGGHAEDALLDRVVVIRDPTGRPRAGRLDVEAILAGREPDLALAAGDCIWVPGPDQDSIAGYLRGAATSFTVSAAASAAAELNRSIYGGRP